jgi:hypothetical protein
MDDVILLFPSGQTNTGRRVKKVTTAQAKAVRTLARVPHDARQILLRMVNEWAETLGTDSEKPHARIRAKGEC